MGITITLQGCTVARSDAAGKKPPPVTPAVLVVLVAAMMAGYMVGGVDAPDMVAPVLPYIMEIYEKAGGKLPLVGAEQQCDSPQPCWCSADNLARDWFLAIRLLASAAGALPAAMLSRMAGRKATVLVGTCLFLAGLALQATAWCWQQLLAGALMTGPALTLLLHSVWIECAEVAPPQWRASFLACFAVGRRFGMWVVLVCMQGVKIAQLNDGWRVIIALGGWPSVVMLVLMFWFPETPNSLIQRGKLAEGREMLATIRGPFYTDREKELMDIWKSAGRPSSMMQSKVRVMLQHFQELWQRQNLPPLLVSCLLALLMDVTADGVAVLAPVLAPMLEVLFPSHTVFPAHAFTVGATIVGACAVLGCVVAAVAAVWVSPKTLIVWGCLTKTATWFGIGLILKGLADSIPRSLVAALLVLFAVNALALSAGLFSMFPVVVVENQPLSTRAHAVALTIGIDSVVRGVTTAMQGGLVCRMAETSFFFAAGISAFVAVSVGLLLPDTKHVPLELVNECWRSHWLWKRWYRQSLPTADCNSTMRSDMESMHNMQL